MSYSPNSLTTGLLSYNLKKEFLNDGLFYRETEVYNYQIYALPSTGFLTGYTEIETLIKNAFTNYSGDLTIKNLSESADFLFPNDHIRVGKFGVEIQIRKPIVNLSTYQPEIQGNYYKGLDETFWGNYGKYLNDFKEDFGYEIGENGNNVYSHSINFSINSGDKTTASTIATSIFASDKDTTLGISYASGTGAMLADTGSFRNYYSETFDLIKNTYGFVKKREILPIINNNFTYNLSHSLNLKEDGLFDVSEKASIQGKLSFSDAQIGYNSLYVNSFDRCNEFLISYRDFAAGQSTSFNLINIPLNSSRTLNKSNFSIDYDVLFSNNPNFNSTSGITSDETIELSREENSIININHSYLFNVLTSPITPGIDSRFISLLTNAKNSSPTRVSGYYQNSSLYDSTRPINHVKMNAFAGSKRKTLNFSSEYSNNPIYFITLDGTTYTVFDTKFADTKPADIVSEYKIINKKDKMSILNYAFQTERGVKSLSISARLPRSSSNMIISPRSNLSSNLVSLYKFAASKILETLKGTSVLALTYFLSDLKYRITSDNEIGVDVNITYTLKKYRDK